MATPRSQSMLLFGVDPGSSTTAVTAMHLCPGKRPEIIEILGWGRRRIQVIRGALRPPKFRVSSIRAIKAHIDDGVGENANYIRKMFHARVERNGVNGDEVYAAFLKHIRDHTYQYLERLGHKPHEQIQAVMFCLPSSYMRDDLQKKVISLLHDWGFEEKGHFVEETEAELRSMIQEHKDLQEDIDGPDGVNAVIVGCGGMVMNFGAYHVQQWTMLEDCSHMVIRQVTEPKSVNAGTEYIAAEISERAGKGFRPCFEAFLKMGDNLVDIRDHEGNVVLTASELKNLVEAFYGTAIDFFKKQLQALKAAKHCPEYILLVGGSSKSPILSKPLHKIFEDVLPEAKVITRVSRQSTATCAGAVFAWQDHDPEKDRKLLELFGFGIKAEIEAVNGLRSALPKPQVADRECMFVLKESGRGFREFDQYPFKLTIDFGVKATEGKIAECIGGLSVSPCYMVKDAPLNKTEEFHPYLTAAEFARSGIDMDPIKLNIPSQACERLATSIAGSSPADTKHSKGRKRAKQVKRFSYEIRFEHKKLNEMRLVVTSGGEEISTVALQLARDVAGSGRFIFVPLAPHFDPTVILFDGKIDDSTTSVAAQAELVQEKESRDTPETQAEGDGGLNGGVTRKRTDKAGGERKKRRVSLPSGRQEAAGDAGRRTRSRRTNVEADAYTDADYTSLDREADSISTAESAADCSDLALPQIDGGSYIRTPLPSIQDMLGGSSSSNDGSQTTYTKSDPLLRI
ncbi:hypothetical protein PT974_10000 [Cladobotryum mycophilum]|uniref:Uncharacterized protein n=1 Tax=Cladobotryum mycophilum TaxID=491253 RepID=A0ABR0S9J4_9HYPO